MKKILLLIFSSLVAAQSINAMKRAVNIDHKHINDQDVYGETSLIRAVNHNDAATVQFLIKNWASLDIQDIYGRTALMKAAYLANPEILELLIQACPDFGMQTYDRKWTALTYAVASGDCRKVQMLLDAGAPTKNKDEQDIRELIDLDSFLNKDQKKHMQSILTNDADFYEEE